MSCQTLRWIWVFVLVTEWERLLRSVMPVCGLTVDTSNSTFLQYRDIVCHYAIIQFVDIFKLILANFHTGYGHLINPLNSFKDLFCPECNI